MIRPTKRHINNVRALVLLGSGLAAAPTLAQETTAQPPAPEGAPFDVLEYRVLGNTVLPRTAIEKAVYPFLGSHKTIADVEAARTALERAYHDAGYGTVFVDIPEQQVAGGIVRLRSTEGRIDRVRITGARYFSNGEIRTALPALARGTAPHLPQLQEQLAELNRQTGDRSVVPVLRAGRTPGTVDIELKVKDELPVHGGLEVNDRYSADTSEYRATASLGYSNLFQLGHSLSLQYQTAPKEPDDVESIVGTYVFGVPAWRNTKFALYAVDSDTDVATLGTLSVIGKGQIYGLRAIHSLPVGENYFHSVTFGVDYKDFLEDIRLIDADGLVTPVRYVNWSASYDASLRGERTFTGFTVGANFGIREIRNDGLEFEQKRFKGSPNYFYLRASLDQLYTLPLDLQLFARLSGQFTQDPLVSNEQFAIGGADTVRGYLESTALGDYGGAGTFEVRQTSLSKLLQLPTGAAYVMAFYDAGIVQLLSPLPSQVRTFDLASAGVGFRILGWHGLTMGFDWAHAFESAGRIEQGDERTHFSFSYAF
jgi:hemolysin activation/secretion protein